MAEYKVFHNNTTNNKLEYRVVEVLNRITLEIIPGFEWFVESPQLGNYGFVHCKAEERIIFKYMALVVDLNSWSDEQIINHAHAVLGIERKERTVKMASSEQKKEARSQGQEKAEIWIPAFNPDLSPSQLFAIGMELSRMYNYSDVDTCMAFVSGFTASQKKPKLLDRKGKLVPSDIPVGANYDALPYTED
jgi:hypothetical protein